MMGNNIKVQAQETISEIVHIMRGLIQFEIVY